MSEFMKLKQERDGKYYHISLIKRDIEKYQKEISIREVAIQQMIQSVHKLQDEAQVIADKMLEIEYNSQP